MLQSLPSFILSLLFFLPLSITAHEIRPSYLELIQISEDTYQVSWKVPAKGSLRLALDVVFDRGVKVANTPIEFFSGNSYIKKWQINDNSTLKGSRISIRGLNSTFTETLVRVEFIDGTIQLARLMPESPSFEVMFSPSKVDVVKVYTILGIKHIWLGIDHLLFLVCLLFIAGTGKRIFITITGFTIAHSVTLALASLNIVNLSIAPVEAIIALSIVFLATEIAKDKRDTITWKYPVSVSSSFGLLHGFGFASVLNEIGLPQSEVTTGLLFFNLGVEIGQLAFIFLVIVALKLRRLLQLDFKQAIFLRATTYAIGALASFWLIERIENML